MNHIIVKIIVFVHVLFILGGCATSGASKTTQGAEMVLDAMSSQDLILLAYEHDAQAQYELGLRYGFGKGLVKNLKSAIYWMRSAANQGHTEAQFRLGGYYAIIAKKLYDENEFDKAEKLFISAKEWIEPLAENGHIKAQHEIARLYENGYGVDADWTIAEKWFRLAASQGDPYSEENLARAYYSGRGTGKKNYVIAAEFFQRAAKKGLVLSQFLLGTMYREGQGVSKNDEKAFKWIEESASNGFAEAQNYLGWMYGKGQGVIPNDGLAVYWFQRAATQGHKVAKTNLARRYIEGKGVSVNLKKAKELDPDLTEVYSGGFLRADPNANQLEGIRREQTKDVLEWK